MTADFGERLVFDHHYVTDARFTHRFALLVTRLTITRSVFIVVVVAIAAVGLLGLLGSLTGLVLSLSTGRWHDISPMLAALVITAVLLGLMVGLGYASARATLDRQFPIGSTFSAGLGETHLALAMPGSAGEIDYRNYRSVTRYGDFVYLASRTGNRRTLLPAQLFPGAALDELRARIADGATRL